MKLTNQHKSVYNPEQRQKITEHVLLGSGKDSEENKAWLVDKGGRGGREIF